MPRRGCLAVLAAAAAAMAPKYAGPGFRVVRCFPHLSRRNADQAVCDGRVTVNGAVAKPALRVKTGDVVTLDGRRADWEPFAASLEQGDASLEQGDGSLEQGAAAAPPRRYILYRKPAGVACTTDAHDKRSLRHQPALKRYFSGGRRVFPVGRLDADSEGLARGGVGRVAATPRLGPG